LIKPLWLEATIFLRQLERERLLDSLARHG